MRESLDQQRARFAWERVQRQSDKYGKLAKGAPALIMASGLMPVLAFYKDKGKDHHRTLCGHLCEWLHQQFNSRIPNDQFPTVMTALMGKPNGDAVADARFYQHATAETMELLRWIRQFAAAVGGVEGGSNV